MPLLRRNSCGCRGNRRSREVRKRVINGCGSGALMMRAMWTRLPSKVVSALWAGSRNSYSLPTQERELREMTLRQSRRCSESLMVISPSCSSPAKPVLIMARKSMSSCSRDSCRALAIVHKWVVVRGDLRTVGRPWRQRAPFSVRLTSAVARLARMSGKKGSRQLQMPER